MRAYVALLLSLAVGCASPGENQSADDDSSSPDAGAGDDQDASIDAPAVIRVGGWRSRGGDASKSYRSATAGPGTAATKTVFTESDQTDVYVSHLAPPVIDEDGNLYFTSNGPGSTGELFSMTPSGDKRWRVPMDNDLDDLVLGPDGDLYAIREFGSDHYEQNQIVAFDPASGTRRPENAAVLGVGGLAIARDGTFYTQGDALIAQASFDAAPRWTSPRTGAIAVSPPGDMVVVVGHTVPSSELHAPQTVTALDAATGAEKWHYDIDPLLKHRGAIAIGPDGSTYVAVSKNGSDLTVLKFSPTGEKLWTAHDSRLTWASRILIGSTTITVGAQVPYDSVGITFQQSDGTRPPGASAPCGNPLAIDSTDVIYWSCNGTLNATTPTGSLVKSWSAAYASNIALGPDGSAYQVPAAYSADHRLFRFK